MVQVVFCIIFLKQGVAIHWTPNCLRLLRLILVIPKHREEDTTLLYLIYFLSYCRSCQFYLKVFLKNLFPGLNLCTSSLYILFCFLHHQIPNNKPAKGRILPGRWGRGQRLNTKTRFSLARRLVAESSSNFYSITLKLGLGQAQTLIVEV